MTYINPLANALPQSFATQHEMSATKTRQMRGAALIQQGPAAQVDQFEPQVQSTEEAAPIHEEGRQKRQPRGRRQQHLEEEPVEEDEKPEHIDFTA